MMKPGAAETAPLLQRQETHEKPKPGAIAAAVRQAKRGVGVFGVAFRAEKQELSRERQVEKEPLIG